VEVDEQLAADLGVALNESSLAGVEYVEQYNQVGATFVCMILNEDRTQPEDSRRQIVFSNVGRIAASLRLGHWDDEEAPIEPFEIQDLLKVVQSFECEPIYGWSFFNVEEKDFEHWGDRLSLDFRNDSGSMKNSILLFQAGYGETLRHLDLMIWFESFVIRDAKYQEIPIKEFTSAGIRWWEAMFKGELGDTGGIIPLKDS
jgi:hypothetical protein